MDWEEHEERTGIFFSVFFCCLIFGFVCVFVESFPFVPRWRQRKCCKLIFQKGKASYSSLAFFVLISWYQVRGIGFVGINRPTLVIVSHPACRVSLKY